MEEGDGGEGVCVVVEWRDNYLNCPVLPTPSPTSPPSSQALLQLM